MQSSAHNMNCINRTDVQYDEDVTADCCSYDVNDNYIQILFDLCFGLDSHQKSVFTSQPNLTAVLKSLYEAGRDVLFIFIAIFLSL